jgi:glycerol uptake facilitator-like aquaporin
MRPDLTRRVAAEFLGTAFLLIAIVGSGIMGERLAAGNVALALLTNSIATGAALVAIILALGEISGAHLNPVVTLAVAWERGLSWPDAGGYVAGQILGAVSGVVITHGMFEEPLIAAGAHVRTGGGQWLAEVVATFGLLTVIWGAARARSATTAFAVGAYITGAYWFTASTSFANPAVTVARSLTNTFTAIRPVDVFAFVFAQLTGAAAAVALFGWLVPTMSQRAEAVVQPHGSEG